MLEIVGGSLEESVTTESEAQKLKTRVYSVVVQVVLGDFDEDGDLVGQTVQLAAMPLGGRKEAVEHLEIHLASVDTLCAEREAKINMEQVARRHLPAPLEDVLPDQHPDTQE